MRTILGMAVALVLGLLATADVQAQVRPVGHVNVIVGFPQGAFEEKVNNPGFGLNAFAGVALERTPLVVGVELGGLIYGFERRSEPFSSTIPDVTVDVETSNNIVLGHLLVRLQPPTGLIRPYVDGLFGFKYLFTQTEIRNERFGGEGESIAVSRNFDDTALSYGAGGGLLVRVYSGQESGKLRSVSVNLGIRYLFGSEAEYLKEGSIRRENGQVTFEVERSRTDLLMPQVGVTLGF